MAGAPQTVTRRPGPGAWLTAANATLPVASAAMFLVVLDTTALNVALQDVGSDLSAGVSSLQWVVDGYTIIFASLLLSVGGLADRIGASVSFIRGLALFGVASLLCGVAPSLGLLLAARVLQGAAAALMMPSSLAMIGRAYPDPIARAKAISVWTGVGGVAIGLGPIVGGVLTGWLGWRSIFFINVPFCVAGLLASRLVVRVAPREAHLDVPGQILAALTLGALTFGVIQGGHDGFADAQVVAALALALVGAVTFVVYELRVPAPLLPLRLFAPPAAATAIGVGLLLFFAFYGEVFTLGLYFQRVLDHTPAIAGVLFLPLSLCCMASTLAAGRMNAAHGPWVPMALGLVLLAGGLASFMTIDATSAVWQMSLASSLMGLGAGFAAPPVPVALVAALPAEQAGVASAVYSSVRQVGAGIGVAVFGALLAGSDSFVGGMHLALAIASALLACAVLAVLAFIRPRDRAGHLGLRLPNMVALPAEESFTRTYRAAMGTGTPIVRTWGRLQVSGLEHLPATGPALVAGNHDSYWDPVAIGIAALHRRQIRALAKSSMWRIKGLGWVLDGMGQIPIERGIADAGAMSRAVEELRAGACIGIFPEGTRSLGRELRARSGFGRLAQEVPEAAVVCAAVTGTTDIPRFPKRPRIGVRFFVPAEGGLREGEMPGQLSRRLLEEIRSEAPFTPAGRRPKPPAETAAS